MPIKYHRLAFLNYAVLFKDIKESMYDMYKAHEQFPFVLKDPNNVEDETYDWINECVRKRLISKRTGNGWIAVMMGGFNQHKLDELNRNVRS
jgi:hypothetical protein